MDFDLIVIGSGPGGYKAAVTAAQLGTRVALIEGDRPGGTCLNQGCVPKEALMRLAHLMEETRVLQGRGLRGEIRGEFEAALRHKDEVVNGLSSGLPAWLRQMRIQFIRGRARLISPKTVRVTGRAGEESLLSANRIVIATGAAPRQHPACPVDGRYILDSRDFMFRLDKLPASVLCVGGGAIGTELGYLLHQFGAKVTVTDEGPRLLDKPCIPERASGALRRRFARLGIEVRVGCRVESTEIKHDGVSVTFSDGTRSWYERVLVAIGRRPRSEDLGLEAAGVVMDSEGFIRTNAYLQTSRPGIYAVGDVKRGPMTANAAFHDARIAALNAINGNKLTHNYNRVPIVIDSALQIAAVGLTEERAEDAGFEPEVARTNLAGSAMARVRLEAEGFVEVVHDEETGQLLGGSVVGPQAGEMIQMLTAACQSSRGLWFFTDMNYTHPSWNEELETAIGRQVLSYMRSGHEVFRPGIYAIK